MSLTDVITHLQQMPGNRFLEKFQSKTNVELERIAQDPGAYVFVARHAASIILKNRNSDSPVISAVEKEAHDQKEYQRSKSIELAIETQDIIKRLKGIPKKTTKKYRLTNGNELQVRRMNEFNFEVRIETSRSFLAPVMICKVFDDSTFTTFPFIYMKSFLILGIGGSTIALILSLLNIIESSWQIILIPVITSIGFQLLLVPLVYFVILKFFKETLRN